MANDPDSNGAVATSLGQGGRYLIRRELGRGMMGVVWEADDTVLGRTVAVKTIELGFDAGGDTREQFERRFFTEARVAAQLSHPGIVVCHDVDKDPASGKLFIVFEHLKGQTLAERVLTGPIPWREALEFVVAVARAAHHAHEHGVVHRDLKPANVMLLEARAAGDAATVKIMDFGVARLESTDPRLTSEGDRFGSPAYMSPEMTLGLPSDAHSDIFSIGSILCTCLLGREWFAAPTIPTTLQRVVHQDAPVVSALVPGVPAALDPVVARAMAKRPEDRHASAAELADDLEDVLTGHSPGHFARGATHGVARGDDAEHPLAALVTEPLDRVETAAAPPTPPPPAKRSPHRLVAVGAAAALALGLVAGVLLLRFRPRAPPAAAPAPSARQVATPSPRPRAEPVHPSVPRAASPRPPATESRPVPAPAAEAAVAGEPPQARTRLRLDVEHPLESGHLVVWIDGALAFETKLQAATSKKVVALTFRSGHLDTLLDITPGRHEVRVEVRWDGGRRVASTVADAAAGSTGLLEVRLGRMTKELRLSWSRLAGD
ncbi:MAG TPA: serine/threonine-protein kinase [Vicinamibacteria bacterium]|nr:serine/threonine-protein kinase [Vicinamibacteria bacterium]